MLQLLLSAASKLDKLKTLTPFLASMFKNRCWFWQTGLEYTEARRTEILTKQVEKSLFKK